MMGAAGGMYTALLYTTSTLQVTHDAGWMSIDCRCSASVGSKPSGQAKAGWRISFVRHCSLFRAFVLLALADFPFYTGY